MCSSGHLIRIIESSSCEIVTFLWYPVWCIKLNCNFLFPVFLSHLWENLFWSTWLFGTLGSLSREQRRVWFADGILPNGETTDTSKGPAPNPIVSPAQPLAVSQISNKSTTSNHEVKRSLILSLFEKHYHPLRSCTNNQTVMCMRMIKRGWFFVPSLPP